LSEKYKGRAKMALVNFDQEPELARTVSQLPHFALYSGGQMVGENRGVATRERLETMLDNVL
jgi:thioredoxin-like negative regulator of GroEL